MGLRPHLISIYSKKFNYYDMKNSFLVALSLSTAAECGEILWSGIFNESATVDDFDKCM